MTACSGVPHSVAWPVHRGGCLTLGLFADMCGNSTRWYIYDAVVLTDGFSPKVSGTGPAGGTAFCWGPSPANASWVPAWGRQPHTLPTPHLSQGQLGSRCAPYTGLVPLTCLEAECQEPLVIILTWLAFI